MTLGGKGSTAKPARRRGKCRSDAENSISATNSRSSEKAQHGIRRKKGFHLSSMHHVVRRRILLAPTLASFCHRIPSVRRTVATMTRSYNVSPTGCLGPHGQCRCVVFLVFFLF